MGDTGKGGALPCGSGSRASHEAAKASSPKASIPNAVTMLALRECFYALVGLHIATGKKSGSAEYALSLAAKELTRLGAAPDSQGVA